MNPQSTSSAKTKANGAAHDVLPDILGERLAIVGGTGSGKSYTARGLVERLLVAGGRVGIIDPTGVWYGLRWKPDGKSAGLPVVMFGGDHSDMPLNETAGRVIAQAVAASAQSWVIDTSALKSKAAERRFMLDFLDAIFEANRDKITLVVDEADRFSPQRMNPESARLHERMEEIVRRGRVRGFVPWLITQRPASLNKDVLSQATGMISMQLTGSHDRKALAEVIEGQADKDEAKRIIGTMPNHQTGQGLVWVPRKHILEAVSFPRIVTFDSMKPPEPGERQNAKALPPIDLGALREKLATVENEAKANDPKALKAEIARLKREAVKPAPQIDPQERAQLLEDGFFSGYNAAQNDAREAIMALQGAKRRLTAPKAAPPRPAAVRATPAPRAPTARAEPSGDITRPQQKILDALAMLEGIGIPQPSRAQLALWAEVSPTSGGYFNNLGTLRTAGLIDYPAGGTVALTDAGRATAHASPPPSTEEMQAALCAKVGNAKAAILRAAIEAYPESVTRDDLAARIGVSPTSGGYFNNLGALRTLGVIDYPAPGQVAALPILFVE